MAAPISCSPVSGYVQRRKKDLFLLDCLFKSNENLPESFPTPLPADFVSFHAPILSLGKQGGRSIIAQAREEVI